MKVLIVLLWGLLFFCSGIDIYCAETKKKRWAKPFLMPLVAGIYILTSVCYGKTIRWSLAAALLAGWLGDMSLINPDENHLKLGILTFLIGHVLYFTMFIKDALHAGIHLGCLWIVPLYVVYAFFMYRYLKPYIKKELKAPTIVYMVLITMMSAAAFFRLCAGWSLARLLCWSGSLIFVISDSLVSIEKYKDPYIHGVMETYIPAQVLIMLGILLS